MIIKSDRVFKDGQFKSAIIEVNDGKITDIREQGRADLELTGMYVLPGFIDIHTHGCAGFDTMDADVNGMLMMKKHMASKGVTSFLPTTMTMDFDKIKNAILCAKKASEINEGAQIAGVYLEGPYFCHSKKGGQNADYLRNPDADETMEWIKAGDGLVKIISIAPELDGAKEFAEKMSPYIRVSVGHTDATYEQVTESGIKHATHLFNAMSPFTHRAPGAIGAVLENEECTAEIICDKIHVHPGALKLALKTKGSGNLAVISDSMRAAGMPDGEYDLGGQSICVKDGIARTKEGNLAGSTTNILDEFKNLAQMGVPLEDIAVMTSQTPAKIANLKNKGEIKVGNDGDFTVLDKDLNLVHTIVKGKLVRF